MLAFPKGSQWTFVFASSRIDWYDLSPRSSFWKPCFLGALQPSKGGVSLDSLCCMARGLGKPWLNLDVELESVTCDLGGSAFWSWLAWPETFLEISFVMNQDRITRHLFACLRGQMPELRLCSDPVLVLPTLPSDLITESWPLLSWLCPSVVGDSM